MRNEENVRLWAAAYALIFAIVGVAGNATAEVTREGTALQVGSGGSGGLYPDVAFDDKHDAYLAVWGDGGTGGSRPVWAQLIARDGGLIGSRLQLTSCGGELYGQKPKVAYSSGTADDVFMVVYREWCSGGVRQWAHLARYSSGGVVSLGRALLRDRGSPGAVIYNPQRGEFVSVWEEVGNGFDVMFRAIRLVRSGGAVTGFGTMSAIVPVADWNKSQGLPDIALDQNSQTYFTIFQGEDPDSASLAMFGRTMDAATHALSPPFFIALGGYPVEPAVVYLPGLDQFLAVWRSNFDVVGRRYASSGAALTNAYPVVARPGTDGAPGAAYDQVRQVGIVAAMNSDYLVWGTEISSSGAGGGAFRANSADPTPPGGGTFYPQVAATGAGRFGLLYGIDYNRVYLDRFTDGSGGGSGGGAPPPPPPPTGPTSDPAMEIEAPTNLTTVGTPFTMSGWAIDRNASSGTGVDAVHLWAVPAAGGSALFIGSATYGLSRPDIASTYGAQFQSSGWALGGRSLPTGTWRLDAFMHSTVTGTFTLARSVTVTSGGPAMRLDKPSQGASFKLPYAVGGWAIDRSAPSGTGVNTVHVWAYPVTSSSYGTPVFVGSAKYGGARPDVAATYGSRFSPSAFNITARNLSPGKYLFAAFARSTVTGTFNNVDASLVTVLPGPIMNVDQPTQNQSVGQPFAIAGWALDLAAPSGTGVSAVHVWAYPAGGGTPIFLGAASLNVPRPDLEAIYGTRAAFCGFALSASGLAKGKWMLAAFAHSTVTGSFNNVYTVNITVP